MRTRSLTLLLPPILLCCLLMTAVQAQAESAFIIDQVEAGLHESSDINSPIVKVLPTGSKLEIMAREGTRVQVRDNSGAVGWIDQRYLMPNKPTRQLLNETEAELERTRAELRQLREQRDQADGESTPAELQRLKLTRDRLQKELAAERDQVAKLRSRINELEGRPDPATASQPATGLQQIRDNLNRPRYLAATVVVLLLLGVLLGVWLLDYLNRRRHGGFRI